jgi:hypothetical protein
VQKILILLVCLLVPGQVWAETAAMMVYKVWEQGVGVYFTRILVTDRHVRFDDGSDASDFTLFDRRKEAIYNVSLEDRSVLLIEQLLGKIPGAESLNLTELKSIDEQAPLVAGKKPVNIELLANGKRCSSLVAIEGVMGKALAGLREFKQVLARVQAATILAQPGDLQTPCDLAGNVYGATRTLDHGLPIEERSEGRAQLLVDYAAKYEVDARLFDVPEGFAIINRQTLPAI